MTQQCPSSTQINANQTSIGAECSVLFLTKEHISAGTASGGLFALHCPDLENYSHARAHKQPTLDAVAVGDGVVSVSADWIRFHNTGSVPKLTIPAAQVRHVHASLDCAHGSPAVTHSCKAGLPHKQAAGCLRVQLCCNNNSKHLVFMHTHDSPLSRACWRLMMFRGCLAPVRPGSKSAQIHPKGHQATRHRCCLFEWRPCMVSCQKA